MKLTTVLNRQARHNLYRVMRNQWKVARKRRVMETVAAAHCQSHNLEVIDANEFVKEPRPTFDFSSIVGLAPKEVKKDENHPLYKEKPCFVYRDNSVLLEGLHQALVLTNTVQLQDSLPLDIGKIVNNVNLPNQDELVKRCIKTSILYDAEQKKLPKKKDPNRPTINLPREYGITDSRLNRMLCSRLLHLCALACPSLTAQRSILHNVPLSVSQQYDYEDIQLELCADVFITASEPLSAIASHHEVQGQVLPELMISHPLISIEEDNFYELKNVYSLEKEAKFNRVHTIMVHYNASEIGNIFETPVTETQTLGRSLMKCYTAAVAQARYSYGQNVADLPEPVVVQCVQTDGQTFHFSVLQLNSTDMTGDCRNIYWSLPPINLYEDCSYIKAVPNLQGYNPEVFKNLLGFYMNNM